VKIVKRAKGFTLINIYIEFESPSWLGVLDTTLCDKICQSLAAGRRFLSTGTPVSSTIKTDCHHITEILLKVALNAITLTLTPKCGKILFFMRKKSPITPERHKRKSSKSPYH